MDQKFKIERVIINLFAVLSVLSTFLLTLLLSLRSLGKMLFELQYCEWPPGKLASVSFSNSDGWLNRQLQLEVIILCYQKIKDELMCVFLAHWLKVTS